MKKVLLIACLAVLGILLVACGPDTSAQIADLEGKVSDMESQISDLETTTAQGIASYSTTIYERSEGPRQNITSERKDYINTNPNISAISRVSDYLIN